MSKLGDMKKMYDKYKQLEKVLKNLTIRAKEGMIEGNVDEPQVVVEITGEMKLKNLEIKDDNLLDPSQKEELQEMIVSAFQKAQNKAQEVVQEKTKEILGVDTNDLAGMLGWGGIPGLS